MKFADKIFVAITALLTLIFAAFGIWIISVNFQRILNREIARGDTQSQMFQYLFEIAYQSTKELGEDYAIPATLESVVGSVEQEGTECFALSENDGGYYFYGNDLSDSLTFQEEVRALTESMKEEDNYIYAIRKVGDKPCLIYICAVDTGSRRLYLGIKNDLSTIYEDRNSLINEYRIALILLLLVGGIAIYLLSHYLTKPIRDLKFVAKRIARGDNEQRSRYHAKDEIGDLAESFNTMADKLVEQMKEKELEAKQKELEAKQKEDFTAAFAHELKTPLTSIIGYADMLNSVELSEAERRQAYYYIYNQGKRLENLSHKLLELVSLEKQELDLKKLNTKAIEENLRITMHPIFAKKKIHGRIDMEKGTIYGDRDLLLSLLYNLLDNSVKAVEENGYVFLKGENAGNGYEIKVIDNGRGIPQEEISRITEAFYMVDKSRSRKEGGAGIGMALCQRIIRLHGGIMQIESKLGEGTIMRLLFPEEGSLYEDD